jgi:tRNA U54 and U55 pseudouridine synthase Pus10
MLGEGRPFVVILSNPKISCSKNIQELTRQANSLQETINTNSSETGVVVSKLTINSSHVSPNKIYKELQILSEEKQKIYGCLCYSPFKSFTTDALLQALEPLIKKDCIVQQKTPLRVAHRRSGITR